MEKPEILEKVIAFLAEQSAHGDSSIKETDRISETTLIDSLTVLEVVMFLEEEFGIRLKRNDLEFIETPERIVELIIAKQSAS